MIQVYPEIKPIEKTSSLLLLFGIGIDIINLFVRLRSGQPTWSPNTNKGSIRASMKSNCSAQKLLLSSLLFTVTKISKTWYQPNYQHQHHVWSQIVIVYLCVIIMCLCSAGVGRTGTYIGLDIGMETAVYQCSIHVLQLVKRLRQERTLMVQAVVSSTIANDMTFLRPTVCANGSLLSSIA